MHSYNDFDPKEKNQPEDQPVEQEDNDDSVVLVNDDGTEFDSSERTYVSVDLPEEEEEKKETADTSGE